MVRKGKEDQSMGFEELGGMRPEDNLKVKIRRVEEILEE